jgi:hypothetical protein
MSATDPLATVWDALERCGFAPHGRAWDFRARCPGHDGDNPSSLHVSEGADGRTVLYCFAHGCDPRKILAPLGLSVRDLFAAGHRHAHRLRLPDVRRSDLARGAREVANVLGALERIGAEWDTSIQTRCSFCGSPRAMLVVRSDGSSTLFCEEACTASAFVGSLAGRVRDAGAAR